MVYVTWETYKSTDGRARVTYHPEWDSQQPWASYLNGTAGRHFTTLELAVLYFRTVHKIEIIIPKGRV